MNTLSYVKKTRLAKPWIYFLATYAWTWSFFGVAYLKGMSAESGQVLGVILVLLAVSGPAVMGIIFTYLSLNREGQKDYWKRIIDFKRISFKWYLVIFFLIPVVTIIAAILSGYWEMYSFSHKLPSLYLTILSVPLVPIFEELGWRGYALDRLQEKYSAVTSSLILGALWGPWHLPAFFLQGSIFGLMSFLSLTFWLYMINTVAITVCFTWIYNNTGRSTLSAILFHIVLEFCANTGLIPWDRSEHVYNVALWIIIAIILTYRYSSTLKLT
ncbi:MAG: type II CAAX endopeptidase family protein [Gammaproteobacteria bacterium]